MNVLFICKDKHVPDIIFYNRLFKFIYHCVYIVACVAADIAYGIVESIASKVWGQLGRLSVNGGDFYLSGGLCELPFILEMLSEKIGTSVKSAPLARYAGAIGAALYAQNMK